MPNADLISILPSVELSSFFRFSSMFLAGMIFYYYKDVIIYHFSYFIISILLIIISAYSGVGLKLLFPILGAYCIFYLAFAPSLKFLNSFGKYGDFSYGIYIYGAFIQQIVIWLFDGNMNFMLNILICMPLAIVCGFLSWHLIEKRFLSLKNKTLSIKALPFSLVKSLKTNKLN
ncbi:hypothetical protein L3V82_09915 [Thiotrichales bacterium 19S3-7]|nr:hypothetical protein [Thiotrichales bacterium 19S3-7]MCF6802474.1 hypothetical protein [Thiotrichales bacterium 19S3-11]